MGSALLATVVMIIFVVVLIGAVAFVGTVVLTGRGNDSHSGFGIVLRVPGAWAPVEGIRAGRGWRVASMTGRSLQAPAVNARPPVRARPMQPRAPQEQGKRPA